MSLFLGYQSFKMQNLKRGQEYEFVVGLTETNFRWFEVDMNGFKYLVEIQSCGTQWKSILNTKGKVQVVKEHISQLAIIHGIPVEQSVFADALKSALSVLT